MGKWMKMQLAVLAAVLMLAVAPMPATAQSTFDVVSFYSVSDLLESAGGVRKFMLVSAHRGRHLSLKFMEIRLVSTTGALGSFSLLTGTGASAALSSSASHKYLLSAIALGSIGPQSAGTTAYAPIYTLPLVTDKNTAYHRADLNSTFEVEVSGQSAAWFITLGVATLSP